MNKIKYEKNSIIRAKIYNVTSDSFMTNIRDFFSMNENNWQLSFEQNTITGWAERKYTCTEMSGYPEKTTSKICPAKELLTIVVKREKDGLFLESNSKIETQSCICNGVSNKTTPNFSLIDLQTF
jgi:hypothetical protein